MDAHSAVDDKWDLLYCHALPHAKMAYAPLPEVNLPRIRTRNTKKSVHEPSKTKKENHCVDSQLKSTQSNQEHGPVTSERTYGWAMNISDVMSVLVNSLWSESAILYKNPKATRESCMMGFMGLHFSSLPFRNQSEAAEEFSVNEADVTSLYNFLKADVMQESCSPSEQSKQSSSSTAVSITSTFPSPSSDSSDVRWADEEIHEPWRELRTVGR